MRTWFEAIVSLNTVHPVEIQKETDKMVVMNGRNYPKNTEWRFYRPTREEAEAALIANHENQIKRAKNRIARAEKAIADVKALWTS